MATLHSGYKGKLLEIEGEEFHLIIMGNLEDKKSQALKNNLNVTAGLIVDGDYRNLVVVRTITTSGELVQNSGSFMLPSFFEDGKYQIALQSSCEEKIYLMHMEMPIEKDFQSLGDVQMGMIEFSSDIGYSTFRIMKGNKSILQFTIEVFPSKMDYMKDYKELIREVNDEVCSLAFEFMGKTYLESSLKDTNKQSNSEFINILSLIFEDIEKALKRIENNRKHVVQTSTVVVDAYKAKRISCKTVDYIRKHPETLVQADNGRIHVNGIPYMATKVVELRKSTTTDIFENRFVKYIISKILRRLKNIEKSVLRAYGENNPWVVFIREKRSVLEYHLRQYFSDIGDLNGKSSMSLVFQMAPGYKEIYKKYVMLNKGLDLGEDLFKITPKKLYKLYEIWCYLKLHHILAGLGYEIEEYGIIKYKDNGLYFSLVQEEEAKIVYKGKRNTLELWYNRAYSVPTTNQRPDTVLCIRNQVNNGDERMFVFDAKYRVQVDANGGIGPMEDDINVMHRYRDSIVSMLDNKLQFKYDTFGAYVMFPYGDEKDFMGHKFYKSIEQVNVGAFPMLPGSTSLIEQHIKKLIGQTGLEAKSERNVMDTYDDYVKFKHENVMVVNVKDQEHLAAYLKGRFYHVPEKALRDVRLGVEYVAFYQSMKAFGEDAGIWYYARIREVVRYRRGECVELPCGTGKSLERYLRLNLEAVEQLSSPRISAVQYGTQIVTYTTLYLLLNAENMHELKLKSGFEVMVYKQLREISEARGVAVRKEHDRYLLGTDVVEIVGDRAIRVNGKVSKVGELKNM